jgi:hypothetical protein
MNRREDKTMRRRTFLLTMSGLAALAATGAPGQQGAGRAQDEPIYGRDLMSEREIQAHRERMRAARTEEERERIRAENHERMRQRAAIRGVELPDAPPPGRGMGQGGGRGAGRPGG